MLHGRLGPRHRWCDDSVIARTSAEGTYGVRVTSLHASVLRKSRHVLQRDRATRRAAAASCIVMQRVARGSDMCKTRDAQSRPTSVLRRDASMCTPRTCYPHAYTCPWHCRTNVMRARTSSDMHDSPSVRRELQVQPEFGKGCKISRPCSARTLVLCGSVYKDHRALTHQVLCKLNKVSAAVQDGMDCEILQNLKFGDDCLSGE
jgi:hypothetical protein